MNNNSQGRQGLKRLVNKLRNEFKRPENTNFYAEEDYREAERKYIKFCLQGRPE